jgi:CheY-like chemotaxis protein
MAAPLNILVTDPNQVARQLIMRSVTSWRPAEFTYVETAAEARAALAAEGQAFDMMFVESELPDDAGARLTKWVRIDEASPRPNLPVVLMSAGFPQDGMKTAFHAGANFLLQKPFNQSRVTAIVDEATSAYPNFIVSPSYIGPDRRTARRPIRQDRRHTSSSAIQIVDDPAGYTLEKDAVVVVFDYLRLRLSRAEPELFREFLLRDHLYQAIHNIPAVRERVLARVANQHGTLKTESQALATGGDASALHRMNGTALQIANETSTAGFALMAAISTSLHHYTSGAYEVSDRLVRFLVTHVSALGSAVAHRIFDDGGNVGQSIISTIGVAEAVFRRQATAKAG